MVCGDGVGDVGTGCVVDVFAVVDFYGVDNFEYDFASFILGSTAEDATLFPFEQGAF